jgi:group I intron endonuclease
MNTIFGVIYKTTNNINGKFYVGKTTLTKKRYERYFGSGICITNAIMKYGIENFEKEVLCTCYSLEQLNRMEHLFICLLKPEYNIAKGGEGGNLLYYASIERKNEVYKNISKGWKNRSIEESTKTKKLQSEKALLRHTTESFEDKLSRIQSWLNSYYSKSWDDFLKERRRRSLALSEFYRNLSDIDKEILFQKRRQTFLETRKNKTEEELLLMKQHYSEAAKKRYKEKTEEEREDVRQQHRNLWAKRSDEERLNIIAKSKATRSLNGNDGRGEKNNNAKKCICIETGEVFACLMYGAEKMYGDKKHIGKVSWSIKTGRKSGQYSWGLA